MLMGTDREQNIQVSIHKNNYDDEEDLQHTTELLCLIRKCRHENVVKLLDVYSIDNEVWVFIIDFYFKVI